VRTSTSNLCLVTALFVAACGDPTAVSDGVLTVARQEHALQLRNASMVPVYYMVVERQTLPRINWYACVEAPCSSVPAAGSVRVADSLIVGLSSAAHEAVVLWWKAVSDGRGGLRAGSIRGLVLPLLIRTRRRLTSA